MPAVPSLLEYSKMMPAACAKAACEAARHVPQEPRHIHAHREGSNEAGIASGALG